MTKSELLKTITERTGLTPKDSRLAVDTVFDSITHSLAHGSKVELRGFGTFGLKHREARVGRNPKTGESVDVHAKRVIFFKPGKEMRERVGGLKPNGTEKHVKKNVVYWHQFKLSNFTYRDL